VGAVQETQVVAVATGGLDRGFLKYSAAGDNPWSPNNNLDGSVARRGANRTLRIGREAQIAPDLGISGCSAREGGGASKGPFTSLCLVCGLPLRLYS